MTADERYVFDERLAILGVMGEPNPMEFQMAFDDVMRFRFAVDRNGEQPLDNIDNDLKENS